MMVIRGEREMKKKNEKKAYPKSEKCIGNRRLPQKHTTPQQQQHTYRSLGTGAVSRRVVLQRTNEPGWRALAGRGLVRRGGAPAALHSGGGDDSDYCAFPTCPGNPCGGLRAARRPPRFSLSLFSFCMRSGIAPERERDREESRIYFLPSAAAAAAAAWECALGIAQHCRNGQLRE